jgi:hypothetical protein
VVDGPAVGLPRILSGRMRQGKDNDMPMQFPHHIFEGAAYEAEVHDLIDWEAADRFSGVYSKHCPAVWGTHQDFFKFLGILVCRMAHDWDECDETKVMDLTDRITIEQSGRKYLFGFAGLELTT